MRELKIGDWISRSEFLAIINYGDQFKVDQMPDEEDSFVYHITRLEQPRVLYVFRGAIRDTCQLPPADAPMMQVMDIYPIPATPKTDMTNGDTITDSEYLSRAECERMEGDPLNYRILRMPHSVMSDHYVIFDGRLNRLIFASHGIVASLVVSRDGPGLRIDKQIDIAPEMAQFTLRLLRDIANLQEQVPPPGSTEESLENLRYRVNQLEARRTQSGAAILTDTPPTYKIVPEGDHR